MAARQKAVPPSKPLGVSDDDWAEAVRREATVRVLAAAGSNDKAAIRAAADALGLSAAQIYRLVSKFQAAPVTASLVVTKPGRKKGSCFLPGPVERQVDDAIEAVFRAREQLTVEKLRKDIGVRINAETLCWHLNAYDAMLARTLLSPSAEPFAMLLSALRCDSKGLGTTREARRRRYGIGSVQRRRRATEATRLAEHGLAREARERRERCYPPADRYNLQRLWPGAPSAPPPPTQTMRLQATDLVAALVDALGRARAEDRGLLLPEPVFKPVACPWPDAVAR